ncbi:MAG: PAS domain S-box protein [Smithella sp.]|nr:PAS domain S-box protein [Smithella sp.]
MKKADIDSILKENQFLKKRNQERENLLRKRTTFPVPDTREELSRAKIFLRSAIDSLPGMFCIVDQRGRYPIWNRNYEKVTGYSNKEISSMTVMDRTPVRNQKAVSEKMRYAFEQETVFEQYGLVCKDGAVKDYLFKIARMESQVRLCLIVNGVEISEQKQARNNLRRSNNWCRPGDLSAIKIT